MSATNGAIMSATPINNTQHDHMLIRLRILELNVGKIQSSTHSMHVMSDIHSTYSSEWSVPILATLHYNGVHGMCSS